MPFPFFRLLSSCRLCTIKFFDFPFFIGRAAEGEVKPLLSDSFQSYSSHIYARDSMLRSAVTGNNAGERENARFGLISSDVCVFRRPTLSMFMD